MNQEEKIQNIRQLVKDYKKRLADLDELKEPYINHKGDPVEIHMGRNAEKASCFRSIISELEIAIK